MTRKRLFILREGIHFEQLEADYFILSYEYFLLSYNNNDVEQPYLHLTYLQTNSSYVTKKSEFFLKPIKYF